MSPFGSSSEMIAEKEMEQYAEKIPEGFILLQDNVGFYLTEKKNLDNKIADPYRYSLRRNERLIESGLDHLVKKEEVEQKGSKKK